MLEWIAGLFGYRRVTTYMGRWYLDRDGKPARRSIPMGHEWVKIKEYDETLPENATALDRFVRRHKLDA